MLKTSYLANQNFKKRNDSSCQRKHNHHRNKDICYSGINCHELVPRSCGNFSYNSYYDDRVVTLHGVVNGK